VSKRWLFIERSRLSTIVFRDTFSKSSLRGQQEFTEMESSVTNATALSGANAIAACQLCGNMRQTAYVKFERNIGMLLLRQTRRLQTNVGKTCLDKQFWDFQGENLLFGPWGMISLIITPLYLITNTVSYSSARRKLQGAGE
jgi:hypothetical protein